MLDAPDNGPAPQVEDAGDVITVAAPTDLSRIRIDKFLSEHLRDASRSAIQRWIHNGRVTMDGATVLPKTRVLAGSEIVVIPAPPEVPSLVPQQIPIDILFEDEHLAVVNKPAGLVVHPAPGHPDGTLVNAMLFHFQMQPAGDAIRPGIVHRLDKDTSGVMAVAKSAQAHEGLVERFSTHNMERRYLAIVWGHLREKRSFDTLHGRHPGDRKKFTARVPRGRRAITHVEPVEHFEGATMVRCTLETGRTHQIRVHLSECGHGLVGDLVYGRALKGAVLRTLASALGRQALHAQTLGFEHPVTGERVRIEKDPPEDFQRLLRALRGQPA